MQALSMIAMALIKRDLAPLRFGQILKIERLAGNCKLEKREEKKRNYKILENHSTGGSFDISVICAKSVCMR